MTARYQVRRWDSFYEDWTMIPETFDNRYDAIAKAIEYAEADDDWYYVEYQVYIECLGGTAWQMFGYADYDPDECTAHFEECFS